ncbi:hypothetical protein llap_5213 [Limosa lapponica baueri]|uniref:Uncharacterized protein n=1 Tax=Limosa lapponica baueri TaxID=1758121 RepID=A0A2I0UEL7_LIMLA|nr:hypothetical protein llap_5213 [Limosa lapponica baueri]
MQKDPELLLQSGARSPECWRGSSYFPSVFSPADLARQRYGRGPGCLSDITKITSLAAFSALYAEPCWVAAGRHPVNTRPFAPHHQNKHKGQRPGLARAARGAGGAGGRRRAGRDAGPGGRAAGAGRPGGGGGARRGAGRAGATRRRPQEEDAHGVQPQPGLPAGVHLRHEALPEQLGAGRAGRLAAPHRDPGEDLVPEPPQQVEAATGRRPGGGQPLPRRPKDSAGPHFVPRELAGERLGLHLAPHVAPLGGLLQRRQLPVGHLPRRLPSFPPVADDRTRLSAHLCRDRGTLAPLPRLPAPPPFLPGLFISNLHVSRFSAF